VAQERNDRDETVDADDTFQIGERPPYDPQAVGRVARRVEIQAVELLGAYFERADDHPIGSVLDGELVPELGFGGFEATVSDDSKLLGCIVNFSAGFETEGDPYQLFARFRLVYSIPDNDGEIDRSDLEQFVHWNVLFNAWPYWREYLASTLNRAQLPRFVVPVMGVPRVGAESDDDLASS